MTLLLTGLVVWSISIAAFAVGQNSGHDHRKH